MTAHKNIKPYSIATIADRKYGKCAGPRVRALACVEKLATVSQRPRVRALACVEISATAPQQHQTHTNHITSRADKQDTPITNVVALKTISKKTTIEPRSKTHLLKCKQTLNLATFNVRTLKTINQLPELTASAEEKI